MNQAKTTKRILGALLFVGVVVGAGFGIREYNKLGVSFQSYHEGASIEIAEAKSFDLSSAEWRTVAADTRVKLLKGPYFFRLKTDKLERTGLIAVNEKGTIVLK